MNIREETKENNNILSLRDTLARAYDENDVSLMQWASGAIDQIQINEWSRSLTASKP